MTRRREVRTWLRLTRTYQKIYQAASAQLKPFGLSMAQFDVLAHIGAAAGVTQQQLADSLLVTKGNVCQLLDRLEERRLLLRRQEGRINRLYLTEAGRSLLGQVVPTHEAAIADQFEGLSPEERAQLFGLLRQLDRSLPRD